MKYIKIYDMGVNQVHSCETFDVNRPKGLNKWLFLVVKSGATFIFGGEETDIEPNTAIFFRTYAPIIYHGLKEKENYCDHWMEFDMEEAAAQLNFSKSHFQNMYRSAIGVSFRNDVIQCRINRASTLLEETHMTITQIASVCGYHSDNYFVRQFKQVTGVTPAQYRKERKKRKEE